MCKKDDLRAEGLRWNVVHRGTKSLVVQSPPTVIVVRLMERSHKKWRGWRKRAGAGLWVWVHKEEDVLTPH